MAYRRSSAPIRATSTRTGVVGARAGSVSNKVYFRGAEEMRKALQRIEKSTRDELLVEATQAAGDVLAAEWKARVPVDDGNYRAAIEAKAKAGSRGATGIVRVGNAPGVPRDEQPRRYASRLEFGSARATLQTLKEGRHDFASRERKAQPSLRPAFDTVRERMVDAMGDVLRRLIEGAN